MNDKILHTFRRTPDDTYTEALLGRLNRIPETAETAAPEAVRPRRLRLAWAVVPLMLMFLLLAVSPVIRARIEDVVKEIGGLTVLITESFPGAGYTPIVVEPDVISLEEARERVEFEFNLPGFIPEGLILKEDEITASNVEDNLRITWEDEDEHGRILHLSVQQSYPDSRYVVGPDSVSEVMVNEIPATLIHGAWYAESQQWEDNGYRMLRWELAGVTYSLETGNEEWGGLSDDELIQVAESVQPPSP